MVTLANILDGHPDSQTSVVVPDGPSVNFGALRDEVERVAGILSAAGVQRGRAISIVLPNGLDFIVTFLAVTRAGAVAAPLNPAYTVDEFKFFMEDADSQLAIVPQGHHPGREAAGALGIPAVSAGLDERGAVTLSRDGTALTASKDAEVPSPEDVALFLHTSGTTSRPKGVPLTHANLIASLANIGDTYDLTPDDVAMVVMPLFHVHGLIGVALSTLKTGGSIVVPSRFSASRFWGDQRETGATWYSAVPTIHQILLMRADDDGAPHESFRLIRSCSGGAGAVGVRRAGEPARSACVGGVRYDGGVAPDVVESASAGGADPGHGRAGDGCGYRDYGRGRRAALRRRSRRGGDQGSERDMADTTTTQPRTRRLSTSGWFRTGDQGHLDDAGVLTLTGRIKELINRGGEKISPLEVDAILLQHPCVAEAVCFGVPDVK